MGRKKDRTQLLFPWKQEDLLGPNDKEAQDKNKKKKEPLQEPVIAKVAVIAIDLPLDRLYSFHIPLELEGKVKVGSLVEVPLGRAERRYKGICINISSKRLRTTLRPIVGVISEGPLLDQHLIDLGRWISDYYIAPIGTVLSSMLPSSIKSSAGKINKSRPRAQASLITEEIKDPNFTLTADQARALERIETLQRQNSFSVILLHGITGSGKTELYIRAIKNTLNEGRSAIFLLPEIALTTQMIRRLSSRLGKIAVLHSGLSPAKRRATWLAIKNGDVKVVVGTRSAIFAPLQDLGLIVVDEEQDTSFKNIQNPRYNARDVAIKRAELLNIPIILGSATPSLETYKQAKEEPNWHYIHLSERVLDLPLPKAILVDMIEESHKRPNVHLLSQVLEEMISKTISSGKQAILLLNRRGHSSYIFCPSCKYILTCPNCKARLVYHKSNDMALCHYCSTRLTIPSRCDRCNHKLNKFGLGTQRVEEEIARKFPTIRSARMDTDTMTNPSKYDKIISDFEEGKIQLLLGTQMIAKGLDFPNVGLVGILCADLTLMIPDFRSAERAFQLIAQVAGRAGRKESESIVVVQSYNLSDPAIQAALEHNYERFARRELKIRKDLSLPPYSFLTRIITQHKKDSVARSLAEEIYELIQSYSGKFKELGILSVSRPTTAIISRLRARYRYQIIIKTVEKNAISRLFKFIKARGKVNLISKEIQIDVDPTDLL